MYSCFKVENIFETLQLVLKDASNKPKLKVNQFMLERVSKNYYIANTNVSPTQSTELKFNHKFKNVLSTLRIVTPKIVTFSK